MLTEQSFNQINKLSFDESLDTIIIVADRDAHSFTEEQFDHLINKVDDFPVHIAITNPCFEFYLLLHLMSFSEFTEEQRIKIKNNNRVSHSRRYCEDLLNTKFKEISQVKKFSKTKYDATIFIERLENLFNHQCPVDNPTLKTQLGSSLIPIVQKIYDDYQQWRSL